jgi:hypothetical protein
MRNDLRCCLKEECNKHVRRYFDYLYEINERADRKAARLGVDKEKDVKRPRYWSLDTRFNPFKVRLKRSLDTL